jgi:hypothetical protein
MPIIGSEGAASSQGFGQFSRQAAAVQAEAIDFDGTNDNLSRASDLVGNVDGKTFTFSAWVWLDTTGSCQILTAGFVPISFFVSANIFSIYLDSTSGGTRSITMDTNAAQIPVGTFVHILYSANVSNPSLRSLYINDALVSGVTYTDYNDLNINWTQTAWGVGGATQLWDGRLSNVFLDYTYRDMSITANRRLFVTADLKPAAGQAALNPILYLPMSDPTAPGLNTGTGGNFTLTGVVARSGRGPNQYNAPYSVFDGSADYLESTSAPAGIADGKAFTVHFAFATTSLSVLQRPITFSTSTAIRFTVSILTTGNLYINGVNTSGVTVLEAQTANATFSINRNYVVEISIDLANASNRHIYVNGVSASTTWFTYSNDLIQFLITTTPRYRIGANAATTPAQYFVGRLGALWFNTSYIDLSQAANLAKFVSGTGINAAPVDLGATGQLPTGTSPLLYLPLYGNNAARNLGTGGGGFGVISGPYTGARGPNEFWGNWLRVPSGSGNYIRRTTGLVGATNVSTFTCSAWFYANVTGSYYLFTIAGTVNGYDRVIVQMDNGQLKIRVANSTDTAYVQVWSSSSTTLVTTGNIYNVLVSRTGSTIQAFLNGVSVAGTSSPSGSGEMTIVDRPTYVGAANDSSGSTGDFWVGEVYFNTHYTNFSQEANRLLFRDAFGNPTNLPSLILGGSVPNPLVYLRTDPASPGTNSGTGGAFTSTLNIDRGQF